MPIEPVFDHRYPLRAERFSHGEFSVEMVLPLTPEDLIDESEFNVDERLPYWAELWPSARALARQLLEESDLPDRAIELGCGIGLPSLALRHRGVAVVATDYYTDALLFATRNAERNGMAPLETRELDWRDVGDELGRFPLAVAADVLYEERNVEPLAAALQGLIQPGGSVLLADPGRSYLETFLERMESAGWSIDTLTERIEAAEVAGGRDITVRLFRFQRDS